MMGRPLALLWVFLDKASSVDSKEAHKATVQRISRPERMLARERLKQMPAARMWLDAEQPTQRGEPEEPRRRNDA